jgi:hypothetical protein
MSLADLSDRLAAKLPEIPSDIAILALRPLTIEDSHRRLRRFLKAGGNVCGTSWDRGEWTVRENRTVVRLAENGVATIYHASGAGRIATGIAPFDGLFADTPSRKQLTADAEQMAQRLGLTELVGHGESLRFERLWQEKAAGVDRKGTAAPPILCRAIGAFRQHVHDLPVLGRASVTVHLAADGQLDAFSFAVRSPIADRIETERPIEPERALRQIVGQLESRLGKAVDRIRVESAGGLRFGYLSLPRRMSQRILAPVYLAAFEITHEQEASAVVLATHGTERQYLPLNMAGSEPPVLQKSKINSKRCC